MCASEITGFVAPKTKVRVTGDATCSEDYSAVLDRPVGIPESCANHCYFWLHHTAHHFAEPVRMKHFYVIVKQCDEGPPRQLDATIIEAAVIKWVVDPLHPNAVTFS